MFTFLLHPSNHELDTVSLLRRLWKEDPELPSNVYAEALAKPTEERWAKSRGVKRSRGPRCVQRLLGKRCGLSY